MNGCLFAVGLWSGCVSVRAVLRYLYCELNLPIEQSRKHVLYFFLQHLDMKIGHKRQDTNIQCCVNFYTDTSSRCWDLRSNYNRRGGPVFRFMLPQQGLGEHPLSPGMPLLISAAINQFSFSPQPHQHSSHLLLLFLCTSLLPFGSFSSGLFRLPQWFSALNGGGGV